MSRSTKQALIGLGFFAVVLVGIAIVASSANSERGLRVDVLSARRAEPGDVMDVTVSIRDTRGALRSVRVDFGDGKVDRPALGPQTCQTPLSTEVTTSHAFEFTGYSTITAEVVTGGCDGGTERVSAIRTVEIKPIRR